MCWKAVKRVGEFNVAKRKFLKYVILMLIFVKAK
jgi:hypothetical protein